MLRDFLPLFAVVAGVLNLASCVCLWAELRRVRREYPPVKSNRRRTPTLRVVQGGRRG